MRRISAVAAFLLTCAGLIPAGENCSGTSSELAARLGQHWLSLVVGLKQFGSLCVVCLNVCGKELKWTPSNSYCISAQMNERNVV
jgi:hypothetical protein